MSRRSSPRPRPVLARYAIASALLLATAALLITAPASAQDHLHPPSASNSGPAISGQISLRGTVGHPQGDLRSNVSGPGGGLHLFFGGWTGANPLLIGVDAGLLTYGRTTDEVPFSSVVGPRVPVEVTTTNNVLETHFSLRLQPRDGWFRPYVEGLVGVKYLFTRTRIGDDDPGSDDPGRDVASSMNYDDIAFSGGAGAGLDVRVFKQDRPVKTLRAVSLHLGVQYLWGSEAEYLAEGALNDENENNRIDRSELEVRRSRTTFLQPQFGVTFRLGGREE